MRVLTIHNYYQQPGGEDVVFAAEGRLLEAYRHEVLVYTDDNRRIPDMSQITLALNTLWSKSSYRNLSQLLKEVRPDVVHFHNIFPLISPAAYYTCSQAGVPVVQTLHNYRLLCPSSTKFVRSERICELCLGKTFPWRSVRYACYRSSHTQSAVVASMLAIHRLLRTWQNQVGVYIALTQFARQKFIEGGLPEKNIHVKPNFVHPDPGIREQRGDYVLFVGRLSPEKGLKTLLHAWQSLKKIPLKILGDGPLMEYVQTFVLAQKLECVDVLGWRYRREVLALMENARLMVFPSICYEGFPMTIAEAFARGVPIVASNLGSMSEIVDDGRTGLHVKPGSGEDLVAKIEWAWAHDKQMSEMGTEARREYERKYTAERNYEMLMEVYQQAIKGARG